MENLIHMPLTKAEAKTTIRQSLISSYEICHQRAWYQHHVKPQNRWSLMLEIGNAVHAGLEIWLREQQSGWAKIGEPPHAHHANIHSAELHSQSAFNDSIFNTLKYGKEIRPLPSKLANDFHSYGELELMISNIASAMADYIYTTYLIKGWRVHYIEEQFIGLDYKGYPLEGTIDLCLVKDNNYMVIDFKTTSASRKDKWENASANAQPLMYTYAVQTLEQLETMDNITWSYLVACYADVDNPTLKEYGPTQFSSADIATLDAKLLAVSDILLSTEKQRGAIGHPLCSREYCDFFERCPHINKATLDFISSTK